jgi:hypothetical protein
MGNRWPISVNSVGVLAVTCVSPPRNLGPCSGRRRCACWIDLTSAVADNWPLRLELVAQLLMCNRLRFEVQLCAASRRIQVSKIGLGDHPGTADGHFGYSLLWGRCQESVPTHACRGGVAKSGKTRESIGSTTHFLLWSYSPGASQPSNAAGCSGRTSQRSCQQSECTPPGGKAQLRVV